MPIVFCDYDDCEDSFFLSKKTVKELENHYCAVHRKSATEIDKTDKPFRSNQLGFTVSLEGDEQRSSQIGELEKETTSDGERDSSDESYEEENGEGGLSETIPGNPYRLSPEKGLVEVSNEIECTITVGETPPATPDERLEEGAETYESKNEDYGESWRQAGEILWKLADEDITVESEEEAIQLGLYFQRLHKLTRGFNGDFGVAELNNEPTTDSHEDEMIYSAMAATISEEI